MAVQIDERDSVCADCAEKMGWMPKDKVVGVWRGKCEFCGRTTGLTSLHHDWTKITFAGLAAQAAELVNGMGLNAPFHVEDGFDGADTSEGVIDTDCDRPCVGDQVRALNIVVQLAKLAPKKSLKNL